MKTALSVCMGALALAVLLVPLVRGARPRRRPLPPPTGSFRVGPLWSWCPAEHELKPHHLDAGARRCISCKTVTPVKGAHRG